MKLVVEEPESAVLLAAIAGRGPFVTSVVGDIETLRVCRRARVEPAQVEQVRAGVAVVALDDAVRALAAAIGPARLRTLDAIHLATGLSLGGDLDAFVTYDAQLADAAGDAGLTVLAPA